MEEKKRPQDQSKKVYTVVENIKHNGELKLPGEKVKLDLTKEKIDKLLDQGVIKK